MDMTDRDELQRLRKENELLRRAVVAAHICIWNEFEGYMDAPAGLTTGPLAFSILYGAIVKRYGDPIPQVEAAYGRAVNGSERGAE